MRDLVEKSRRTIADIELDGKYRHERLRDGRTISVPLSWYPRLLHPRPEQLCNYELIRDGCEIHWPDVDEDVTVEGFPGGQPAAPGTVRAGMRRITFATGQEPKVKIAVSDQCRRDDCERCPGVLEGGIVCVCGHHLKSNQDS